MGLNVVFDSQAEQMIVRLTTYSVDLKNVTPARALEIILATNTLMYAPLDSRTIVVASDNPQMRTRYEMQAVRVFYVRTGDINDMRTALTPLGIKQIFPYKQLNAFVIRDTPANLEVAEHILKALDKDKAEVLIDINMYQVTHNNMIQIGNQFNVNGDPAGGVAAKFGMQALGGFGTRALIGGAPTALLGPFGIALGLPQSSLSFFQENQNAKLLASTQVHVLDGEQHTIRLGQRVPIQTASYPFVGNSLGTTGTGTATGTPTGTGTGTTNTPGSNLVNNAFGFGIPQIQYENVGLNIDMTPTVTSDEVQMKMKIDSTSIVGGTTNGLTPTFNQTTMSSVAKIRDGQTTMIAGISQNTQSKGAKGLPLIGLIPILGRFFTTPDNQNNQSDVVITVTPHILRGNDITESDQHLTMDVGPDQNQGRRQLTIEQILYMADHEQAQQNPVAAGKETPIPLAASQPTGPSGIVTPPQPSPGRFVSTEGPGVGVMPVPTEVNRTTPAANGLANRPGPSAKTVKTSTQTAKPVDDDDDDDEDAAAANKANNNPVQVIIRASPVATKGQQLAAALIASGDAIVTGANIALTYDPNIFEVKAVRNGGMLSAGGVEVEPQFSADGGVLNVTLQRPDGAAGLPARGQLLYVILEVKGKGKTTLGLGELTSFRTASGQPVPVNLQGAQVEVK
jgi:general secretion pathway protein D